MIRVELPHFDRFDAWRSSARHLASARVPAERVSWLNEGDAADLFSADPMPEAGSHPVRASKDFLSLARTVGFHSDPERWSLLYIALLRLQTDRTFLGYLADPLTVRLGALAKSVRRDIHKMHAFVRFHELPSDGTRRSFAAWFEPEHLILQAGTPFFVNRFADMDWLIATPEGVAKFDGQLGYSKGSQRPDLPEDAGHELWQTYFANIFNPARVKVNAMRSEMPVKYWKNLPETRLISDMLADAPRRVKAMVEAGATDAPRFAEKVTARVRVPAAVKVPTSLSEARTEAARCTRCELCNAATQTVWGEGPPDARLMIVGEAPGDQEDLQGKPFVGPAGQLLREIMAEVGIEDRQIWMTNAVKHFKFVPRGKRRLHQNPTAGEVQHCRWWLDLERRFIAPRLTVALGASAAYALTGDRSALTPRRGTFETALDGGRVLITWHPSLILRLKGADARAARGQLSDDLALALERILQSDEVHTPHTRH